MGQTRRKIKRPETMMKSRESQDSHFCQIPIPAPVLDYSSHEIHRAGHDFYDWVNHDWLSKVHPPSFENDFGVSEEVERCVYDKSVEIISNLKHDSKSADMLLNLKDSFFTHNNVSVDYIHSIVRSLESVETVEDIVKHFSALAKSRVTSILNYQYHIMPDKKIHLRLDSNCPSLPISLYRYANITDKYRELLDKVGNLFAINKLSQIYEFEKTLIFKLDSFWNSDDINIKGGKLLSKFPRFPWKTWFETSGLEGWKNLQIYYNSPKWIRFLSTVLKEVPVDMWRLYLAKIYIFHALPYLPSPYSDLEYEFFGHLIQGQKAKMPRMEVYVNTVYKYMSDIFSKVFWESAGDPNICEDMHKFAGSLVSSAKRRVLKAEWLQKASRLAALEKINRMGIETIRPKKWANVKHIEIDLSNCIKNIFDLGAWNTDILFERIGGLYNFWEEGIYRVNAYYFNETNEIVIPYGTVISPFYSKNARNGWNYGALGSIIGHEMCHGFDDDGKDYNSSGQKKNWWTRSDKLMYKKKSAELIELFDKERVYGKHVNGEKTLSENIVDLGGLAIALEALKVDMERRGVIDIDLIHREFREFFTAFAVSWRTKYRPEKLKSSVDLDNHAPAFLRVNLVVSQFQEWYDAFKVSPEAAMYIPPEKRIQIF